MYQQTPPASSSSGASPWPPSLGTSGWKPFVADEVNSLFDVFLLARLIVAGRRSGPPAAQAVATRAAAARAKRAVAAAGPRRRVLGSKDLSRVIAGFLARKLLSEPGQ